MPPDETACQPDSLAHMSGLPRGLYEQLITEGLEEALSALDPKYRAHRGGLHPEEAADRIAFHLAALVRRSVSALDARQRIEVGARLAGEVTRLLAAASRGVDAGDRSEEHTSELQSLMRISYAVFCLKKKTNKVQTIHYVY